MWIPDFIRSISILSGYVDANIVRCIKENSIKTKKEKKKKTLLDGIIRTRRFRYIEIVNQPTNVSFALIHTFEAARRTLIVRVGLIVVWRRKIKS